MDYNSFRTGGGYNARPAPSTALAKAPVPMASTADSQLDGTEGTFVELPVTGGVGPFHINHFIGRGLFGPLSKPEQVVAPLAYRFFREFLKLFEPNEAEAEKGKYKFNGADTIEFSLGGDKFELLEHLGGVLHSDWVSIQKSDDGASFYASTLRRRWLLRQEKVALFGAVKLSKTAADGLAGIIRVNQHHFLAGRRSFRFGYDDMLQRLYIETAAFERSSLCEYHIVEKTGALRATIIDLWTNLIDNVQRSFGLPLVPPSLLPAKAREGYATQLDVDYRTGSFATADEALKQPWFANLLPRHPGLLKGLPF